MAERMEWFRDAKYGVILHWGLYAQAGGMWNGEEVPYLAEWVMKGAQVPLAEYRKLADTFNPVHFDAEKWVKSMKDYGTRYVTFTTKHLDGFAMYDSKVSDYNIMHTPFGRDVLRELADACEKYGLTLCLYYSQMHDWEDPNAEGNTWDYDPKKKDFNIYFENKVKPQVTELLTNYGKIAMIWFDMPYDMPYKLCKELRELVLSLQPDCIINGRIGYGLGDYRQMSDNDIPMFAYEEDWETIMTLNNNWGYSKNDHNWKSAKTVMRMLIEIAGRGGNLAMNIGPDGLGDFPEGGDKIMREVGDWLKVNGESIYGTRRCVDLPYQMRWGGLTYKDKVFYMHVLNAVEHPDEIRICNLETKVKRVTMLATGEEVEFEQSYEIARDEHRFNVKTKGIQWDPLDTVLKVELESEPKVHSLYMTFEGVPGMDESFK